MSGPLSGTRILDFSSVVSGPLATMHLGDQGADVVKVEPLQGDMNRRSRQKVSANGEFSALFISTNRGKRSISLDLKNTAIRRVLRKLVEGADVIVQNFRPGTMERLGLGYEDVKAINPRIVYVSISGVGEKGPYAKKRIYDPMIQALSGLADIQSDQATQRPKMIRTIVADKATALSTAQAITAALFARERTGKGQHVHISLLSSMLAFLWPEAMMQYTVVGREQTAPPTNAGPDLIFPTSDGFMTVGTISDSEWKAFCEAAGRPELITDERFSTSERRYLNSIDRISTMAEILKTRTRAEWLERLDAADVPCAPVLRRNEIVDNEQVSAMGFIETLEQPYVGTVRQARPFADFEGTPSGIQGPAPGIGQHTEEILREIGVSETEIAELKAAGCVRSPKDSFASTG